jgi:CRISPR/Cas system CSM-associated protein Csm4 (group 5 of RAMP superfamily)
LFLKKEPEKANDLDLQDKWRSAMDKAAGVKTKDDAGILKKAVKRIEKKREKSSKSWKDRIQATEMKKKSVQDKRTKNIEKRKEMKKEGKMKKLKKRGRILPGF